MLEDVVQDLLNRTTEAFRQNDLHLASKVEPMESVVNELVRAIKARHIARLQAGSCSITYGFVLDDLLTSYSRISAHCSNVAVAQIEVAQDSLIPTLTCPTCGTTKPPRRARRSSAG